MLSTHLIIGEILKPQGVRGEVKVRPITCDPDRFYDLTTVYFEENGSFRPVKVQVNRMDEAAAYMQIEGVADLLHQMVIIIEIMQHTHAHAQHFLSFVEVAEIGS